MGPERQDETRDKMTANDEQFYCMHAMHAIPTNNYLLSGLGMIEKLLSNNETYSFWNII